MITAFIILFFTALISGLMVLIIPGLDIKRFKVILSFSGAYLFAITVIHILPELFHDAANIKFTGIWVLAGFFLQLILEYFSEGVEHGHIHIHHDNHDHIQMPYSILIALGLHSFLEGTLLVHPAHEHHHESSTLMFGLILHKIPEAFALMSVLYFSMKKKKLISITLLTAYALMSPLGMLLSDSLYHDHLVSQQVFEGLFALVAGNFLYISTTIFFETSPDHKFRANRLVVSILGAVLAVLAEYFL